MVYVKIVKEEYPRDREEFKNRRTKLGNEFGQQKSNVNWSSFQKEQKLLYPSYASALAPRNKGDYTGQHSQNFRAIPAQSQFIVS